MTQATSPIDVTKQKSWRVSMPTTSDKGASPRTTCPAANGLRGLGQADASGAVRGTPLGQLVERCVAFREDLKECGRLGQIDAREARIVAADVSAVVNQIGELDGLGSGRGLRRVIAIDRIARRSLAVAWFAHVGQIGEQLGDTQAELALQVAERRGGVLDGVVEPGGGDHLRVLADASNQLCDRFEVHLIRLLGVLASLIDALVRLSGELSRSGNQVVHGWCAARSNKEPRVAGYMGRGRGYSSHRRGTSANTRRAYHLGGLPFPGKVRIEDDR